MKKRFSLFIGFMLIVGCLAAYMFVSSNTDLSSNRGAAGSTSISVWIYTEQLAVYFQEFQDKHPDVSIHLRQFHSWKALYEELLTVISANSVPHIAEVGSTYGITRLVNQQAVLQADHHIDNELWQLIPEPFSAAFTDQGHRWAVPIGASVPVIYNNQNLFNSSQLEILVKDWTSIRKSGKILTKDIDHDEQTDIWGLVSDTNMGWNHLAVSYDSAANEWSKDKLLVSFNRWHEYLTIDRIMPPLQHQLAISQFIYGKAGMLVGSSKKRTVLEKYIGGKFDFGVISLPHESKEADLLPDVSGLSVMVTSDGMEDIAWACIRYLLEESVQSQMMRTVSLIPARADVTEQLLQSDGLKERERAILEIKDRFVIKYPHINDENMLLQSVDDQEWMETFPDISYSELKRRLKR